ncbi:DUF6077 domain-containing protein [Pseudokineococcus lusitanus]|uniref:DUF6077 domain-containing protein n=1 Tax=Pseudokineococcus lusitanus TaxID=763993 RepID=UPI0011CDA2DD|nr:DUF6077 domain-containing protein [Pseudokineococcus lusitanus]
MAAAARTAPSRGRARPRRAGVAAAGEGDDVAVGRAERAVRRTLDGTVAVLAAWTPAYHLCLVLGWHAEVAVALAAALLVVAVVVGRRLRATAAPGPARDVRPPRAHRPLLVAAAAAAVVTAVLGAVGAPWTAVAVLWLVAAAAGTAWAARTLHPATPRAASAAPAASRRPGVGLALVAAAGLAVLAATSRWPNPDDLYYVNLSQWTAERGTFPLRDTIFGDEVFPMTSFPPVASYDGLVGTAALLAGVRAADVVYLVVPPLGTALAVLALHRLLRAWRVPAVGLALVVALAFLLWDGGPGYAAPGNLFLIRMWQGKVLLLCLLVPLLLVALLRHAARPSRRTVAALAVGGTAAVGLSTTAMFLVPVLAVGGVAPLLVRRRWRAAAGGFVAASAYPLAAGVVTVAVGGRSADDFLERRTFRFDPGWFGPEIFRDGTVALVGVAAVLLGALLVPHRDARLTTGVLALAVGVTFVPGVTLLVYDVVGLGPTLWRVSWVATVAALVGVLAVRLAGAGTPGAPRVRRVVVPVALVAALVAGGQPIWTAGNRVEQAWPPTLKRGPGSVVVAEAVLARAEPGDVVLLPEQDAITTAVLTTRVKTVAPRDYFLDQLRDVPGFRYDQRLLLVRFADLDALPAGTDDADVLAALADLDVRQACLLLPSGSEEDADRRRAEAPQRVALLEDAGFAATATVGRTACWAR